jgi:hypothetical protein
MSTFVAGWFALIYFKMLVDAVQFVPAVLSSPRISHAASPLIGLLALLALVFAVLLAGAGEVPVPGTTYKYCATDLHL